MAINAFPTGFTLENLLDYSDQPFPSPNLMPEDSQKLAEELKLLPIYFDKASEIVKDDQVEKIDKAAKAILAVGDEYELTVAGFADNIGNADYNRDLSIRPGQRGEKDVDSGRCKTGIAGGAELWGRCFQHGSK